MQPVIEAYDLFGKTVLTKLPEVNWCNPINSKNDDDA
jgi:hypothetical protein